MRHPALLSATRSLQRYIAPSGSSRLFSTPSAHPLPPRHIVLRAPSPIRSFVMSSVPQFPPPHLLPTAEDEAALAAQEQARDPNSGPDGASGTEVRERLALPSPEEVAKLAQEEAEVGRKLDMSSGGGSISFDELGPMVVNENGTLSRIHNWGEMAPIERANTMRIIGKRNKARIERLRKVAEDAEGRRGEEEGKGRQREDGNEEGRRGH